MNKVISIVVVLIIVIGGLLLFKNKSNAPVEEGVGNPAGTVEEGSGINDGPAGGENLSQGVVKEFKVEGGMFYFAPNTMTVNKGDTVKIVFTNKEGMHDWKIDEFNAATKVIRAGQTETIEFIADKSGSFEYYCSVGDHRARGMKGTLKVI